MIIKYNWSGIPIGALSINQQLLVLLVAYLYSSKSAQSIYLATRSRLSNWAILFPRITIVPMAGSEESVSSTASSITTFRNASYPLNNPTTFRFPFRVTLNLLSYLDLKIRRSYEYAHVIGLVWKGAACIEAYDDGQTQPSDKNDDSRNISNSAIFPSSRKIVLQAHHITLEVRSFLVSRCHGRFIGGGFCCWSLALLCADWHSRAAPFFCNFAFTRQLQRATVQNQILAIIVSTTDYYSGLHTPIRKRSRSSYETCYIIYILSLLFITSMEQT